MNVKTSLFFAFLAVIVIASNLTKAVTIDDTAYLGMAQAILNDPWHPLAQEMNWVNTAEPIFVTNQPLLVPALLALGIKIFGESLIALHLIISLTSLVAIAFFYSTAKILHERHALFLTSLFALGPAFLPSQNLMVDMPLIAFWLIFFWAILSTSDKPMHDRYIIAALAVSAACLTKYVSLILLPIFACVLIVRRQWVRLFYLLIPIGFLSAWSVFNLFDFGAIHILGRSTKSLSNDNYMIRLVGWLAGLGSISPFIIGFLPSSRIKPSLKFKFLALISGVAFVGLLFFLTTWNPHALYWALFLVSGLLTFIFAAKTISGDMRMGLQTKDKVRVDRTLILAQWLLGCFVFIVLFSPFLAIRHIFLALPPVLFLLGGQLPDENNVYSTRKVTSLVLTASLGIMFAISDYYYADVYREYASKIRAMLPANAPVWVIGHWGWEWYAKKAGMQAYDTQNSTLQTGDYVVLAEYVHQQQIPSHDKVRLEQISHIDVPAPLITWLRLTYTDQWGGYYAYGYPYLLPWRFSQAPYKFTIFRVKSR